MRIWRFAVAWFVVISLSAAERPPIYREESFGIRKDAPPVVAHEFTTPDVTLPAPTDLRPGGDPPIVGTVRPVAVHFAARTEPRSFRSEGATHVRLRLTNVSMPPDAIAWVIGASGSAAFGAELLHDRTLWTPSVEGDTITLSLPAGAQADVTAIAHIVAPRPVTNADECFVDATCYSASEDVQTLARATALLLFVKNGGVGQCTGTLINGPDGDRQLLTANHCIRTAAEAASVEAFWDFRTSACGGAGMTYTKTAGATLLTTSATTDVTLLRMTSLPSGRWLMGWATDILPTGTLLYRVANPAVPNSTNVYYQAYSVSAVSASAVSCASAPRPSFIYSTRVTGGVGSGSSGAASIIAGGYIVGQLLGGCALGTPDGCSSLTSVMDGSLRASYPVLQPYLDPITTPGCTTTATNICLQNGRFSVSINYRNQFANPPQTGSFVGAQLLAGSQNPDVATFGISSAQAIEVVVRIQDARPFGINRFDVYYGGLTDLEYTVSVTDTQKGTTRTYRNAPGVVGGGVDRTSFPAN